MIRTTTNIHNAVSLTIEPPAHFTNCGEFYSTDIIIKDEDGSEFRFTMISDKPLPIKVKDQTPVLAIGHKPKPEEPKLDPDGTVMAALNDLCTVR